MKSILLISIANIKRRKMQSFLIGSCIALSALLFSTTLGVMSGIREPFDILFNQLKASHILLYFDQQQQDAEDISNWFQEQSEVESVSQSVPFFTLDQPIIYKDEEIDLNVQLTEHHEGNLKQDKVLILKGDEKPHPAMGEIWIPNHLATANNIQIGDTLGIPVSEGLYPLIVSATLVDPHYASGLFNPTRAWLAPGSLPFIFPISKLNKLMLGVRLKSPDDIDALWAKFNAAFIFDGQSLQYDLFKSVFLSFYNIISMVLMIFSVLAILVAFLILFTTLSGAIASDYHLIGIYKAQGFTPGNVITTYLIQYLLLTLISLPIGILGSFFVTKAVMTSLIKSIGLVNLNFSFLYPIIITIVIFLGLVALLTYMGSRVAGKIKPIEALRSDSTTGTYSKQPFSKLLINSNVSVPFFLGLRMLFSNKKRMVYTSLSFLFSIFILVFSINISNSFSKLKENKAAWGFEDSDIQVRLNTKVALPLEHEAFMEIIQREKLIETIIPYSYCSASIPATEDKASKDINGKAYDGNMADIGLFNLKGNHPVKKDEISLCTQTADDLKKQPGDDLVLFIEGQRKTFHITGIYQDVSNLGQGFRLSSSAMKQLNPLFKPDLYALQLKENTHVDTFKNYLQQTFAETVQLELSIEDRKEINSTINNMRNTMILVSLFFLSILFGVLFNDVLMNIHEFKRSFGIFKTIGMTPNQIRMAMVYKTIILMIICLIIGIPIALMVSPALISGMTKGIGLQEFPYLLDSLGTALVIPGMILFTGLSVWWASKRVLKISPKDLVTT